MSKDANTKVVYGIVGILLFYLWLLFFMFKWNNLSDYHSLYTATYAFSKHINPYLNHYSVFLLDKTISINLNPPIVFCLMLPFTQLLFPLSLLVFSILSFLCALLGASLVVKIALPHLSKEEQIICTILSLLTLPMYINFAIGQLGSVLLLLIMAGYHYFLKGEDSKAGVLWGAAVAIKIFPGLLLLFALLHKRYQLLLVMLSTLIVLTLLPLLISSITSYQDYFQVRHDIYWFGYIWNGSFWGLLYRTTCETGHICTALPYLLVIESVIFVLVIVYYIHFCIKNTLILHKNFAITLIIMLLLNPLSWIYYFSLLLFPLFWSFTQLKSKEAIIIWFFCLFAINFPIQNILHTDNLAYLAKPFVYSIFFYGALALLLLTAKNQTKDVVQDSSTLATSMYSFTPLIMTILVTSALFFWLEVGALFYGQAQGLFLSNSW